MVPIRRIIERSTFVDNPLAAFLGFNHYPLYLPEAVCDLGMDFQSCFNCCLGVEFSRKGDLKQDVLHDVRSKPLDGDPDLLTSEKHVLESPGSGAQRTRITHLAL